MVKPTNHRHYAAASLAAALFSFVLLAQALWIPAKAELAQWLIERSWQRIQAGETDARPWPWADTRPAGLLSVPGRGIRQFVLEGNSGRNLAFGPVFLDGGGSGQDLVISGHRDTHFRFLRQLARGDRLQVQVLDSVQQYEVIETEIVDSRLMDLVIEPGISRLSLVTCFPFDTPQAGGPLRYVVTALPTGKSTNSAARSKERFSKQYLPSSG